jgi:hypothetical protein
MKNKRLIILIFILLVLVFQPSVKGIDESAAQAQEERIYVDGYGGDVFTAKDTTMAAAWPTRNAGEHPDVQLETEKRALMEFDLSAIPPDSTLVSAMLYIYHSYPNEGRDPVTITIYSISAANAAWVAGTKDIEYAGAGESCWNALASDGNQGVQVPWAGSPGLSTSGIDYEPGSIGSFSFDASSPIGTEYAVALDPQRVKGWFGPDNTNYGIVLYSEWNTGHIAQSNHSISAYRPKLVVRYIPAYKTYLPGVRAQQ